MVSSYDPFVNRGGQVECSLIDCCIDFIFGLSVQGGFMESDVLLRTF